MQVIDLCNNETGELLKKDLALSAERVHRQLRPNLQPGTDAYMAKLQRIFQSGGRMSVAVTSSNSNTTTDDAAKSTTSTSESVLTVVGVAIWRVHDDTHHDICFYIDDLVTDETTRSLGVGHAMITHLAEEAKRRGATQLTLDSGTHRKQAHKFYFREGFVISSFHFEKDI